MVFAVGEAVQIKVLAFLHHFSEIVQAMNFGQTVLGYDLILGLRVDPID